MRKNIRNLNYIKQIVNLMNMTEWDKMLDDEPLMQRTVEAFFRDILDLM